jgi:ethanolamine ammonia-lyase small subunit
MVDMNEKDKKKAPFVTKDPSSSLKSFTDARIGLGRVGVSLPLKDWLSFKLDHARARDAVYAIFDPESIKTDLLQNGITSIILSSRAKDKKEYLVRPDLGRKLSDSSLSYLTNLTKESEENKKEAPDVLVCICDGLSAQAVHAHSVKVAKKFLNIIKDSGYSQGPVVIVSGGRVAVADEVAEKFRAKVVINLIGERPGLSSPDSMSAYITYGAYAGIQEEARSCISNIRPKGLSLDDAVIKLCYFVENALALKITGTELKDDMPEKYLPFAERTLLVD